jgi:hypothetical protein
MRKRKILIALWVILNICAFAVPYIFRERISTFIGNIFIREQKRGKTVINKKSVSYDTILQGSYIKTDLVDEN